MVRKSSVEKEDINTTLPGHCLAVHLDTFFSVKPLLPLVLGSKQCRPPCIGFGLLQARDFVCCPTLHVTLQLDDAFHSPQLPCTKYSVEKNLRFTGRTATNGL